MANVTMVTLETYSGEAQESFEVEVAERILRMRDSGWQLPKDSEFEFKDGVISRRNQKKGK